VSTIKNALGIFSDGSYLGYMGALNTPIGISLGWLNEGSAFFIDTGFGPPSFKGYGHPGDISYKGNDIQHYSSDDSDDDDDFEYVDENEKTAFLWDMIFGLNINIIKTLLWANVGLGFEYKQDYKLYSEVSDDSRSNKIWIQNGSDDKFKFVVSAGLYVKLWYFYIQGKYKYIVGEEIDMNTYGLNHLSLGIGYVWRKN
jgi:hypothetical protein